MRRFGDFMPDKATKQGPMPDGLGERFEALFEANGDGGGHAACVVAGHFPWLDYWFPEWTHRVLRPMFAIDHPLSEAVWHGFAQSPQWPSAKTLKMLCPHLLALLKGKPSWELDELKNDIGFKKWWFSPGPKMMEAHLSHSNRPEKFWFHWATKREVMPFGYWQKSDQNRGDGIRL